MLSWFHRWFKQKEQIDILIYNVMALQAQFKYLQQRLDRMETPR